MRTEEYDKGCGDADAAADAVERASRGYSGEARGAGLPGPRFTPPPAGLARYADHSHGSHGQTATVGSTYFERDWRFRMEEGNPRQQKLYRHTQQLRARLQASGSELAATVGTGASLVKAWVNFPTPRGINVNMLPFVLGDHASLPEGVRHYAPLIDACPVQNAERGTVGYLTIMETTAGEATGGPQRRAGLHTEGFLAPDGFGSLGLAEGEEPRAGPPNGRSGELKSDPRWAPWGHGGNGEYVGGLYRRPIGNLASWSWLCHVLQEDDLDGPQRGSRRRRGRDLDSPWTGRGAAAAGTWIVRGRVAATPLSPARVATLQVRSRPQVHGLER